MILRLAAVALFVSACLGCSTSEGEEEHLEHAVPEHKPASFAEAVAEIETRSEQLDDSANGDDHEFQELLDIVGWLPELAADSDLDEAEWTRARSVADRLAVAFVAAEQKDEPLRTDGVIDSLAELRALVPAAGKPEPEPPEHGHHHHHHNVHEDDH